MAEVLELAARELRSIEEEVQRRRFAKDPEFWVRRRLGDKVWSKQAEVLQSVRDNRRTAVMSCHEIGKSYIASVVIGWWLDTNPVGEAFVVTSAPTAAQVKTILWREIGRVHARGGLRGRVNQTEWFMTADAGNEEIVAFGRKPDEYDPTAFQGIHARRVLIVFDEACGIPLSLYEAGDSLIANDLSKALLIGNPDDPMSEFKKHCEPGSGYNVIQVGAFDSPNFTGEEMPQKVKDNLIGKTYVEEKRRKWAPRWYWVNRDGARVDVEIGKPVPEEAVKVIPPPEVDPQETEPFWQSKILGLFPKIGEENGLIPMAWIQAAQQRTLEAVGPSELGVDVGAGGDASTGYHRKGPVVRQAWQDHNPDTMHTTGIVVKHLGNPILGIEVVKVDLIGIGRGVRDRLAELKKNVIGVDVGKAPYLKLPTSKTADEEGFVNLRAQLWWYVRGLFETGKIDIDPDDEDLAAELMSIRYFRTSHGKIQIESKKDAQARGVPSPNRADALMLAVAPEKYVQRSATWGR